MFILSFLLVNEGDELDQVDLAKDVSEYKPQIALGLNWLGHGIEDTYSDVVAKLFLSSDVVLLVEGLRLLTLVKGWD